VSIKSRQPTSISNTIIIKKENKFEASKEQNNWKDKHILEDNTATG